MIAAIGFIQLVQTVVGNMPEIPKEERPRVALMVCAIGTVESGGRDLPAYDDVNGKAWGYFGMHRIRWSEIVRHGEWSSGHVGEWGRWGKATPKQQIRAMAIAVHRQMEEARQRGSDPLARVAAWHNGYGTKRQRAAYVRKLTRALEEIER